MNTFEKLSWIAESQCEAAIKAREMIGIDELAIMIAKNALLETSLSLSPTKVSKVTKINRTTAQNKIDNIGFKNERGGIA